MTVNACAKCSSIDADTEAGWSLCSTCFHADRPANPGRVDWAPLVWLLLWMIAIVWMVAALIVLAA